MTMENTQNFFDRRKIRRPAAIVCFSHLRWNFVYQRPQHLMSRFASNRRVFFVEEPVLSESAPKLVQTQDPSGVKVITPNIPNVGDSTLLLRMMVDEMLSNARVDSYFTWYYTPMAMPWSDHLSPLATIYDCMDELAAFKDAPPRLKYWESMLLRNADLVFTGGKSLFEAKRNHHPSVYPFPSSIDVAHFAQARSAGIDPPDQQAIPHPPHRVRRSHRREDGLRLVERSRRPPTRMAFRTSRSDSEDKQNRYTRQT